MSSGAGDLGVLKWIIDADDSALDAKLDAALRKVQAWGDKASAVVNRSLGARDTPAATFGGGPVSGANEASSFQVSSRDWRNDSREMSSVLNAAKFDVGGAAGISSASRELNALRSSAAHPIVIRFRYEQVGAGPGVLANAIVPYGAIGTAGGSGIGGAFGGGYSVNRIFPAALSSAVGGQLPFGGQLPVSGGGQLLLGGPAPTSPFVATQFGGGAGAVTPMQVIASPVGGGAAAGVNAAATVGVAGAAAAAAGTAGAAGAPARQPGIRLMAAGYLALHGLNRVVSEWDRVREMHRVLSRGTIDEGLDMALSQASQDDKGWEGQISRHSTIAGIINPVAGVIGSAGNLLRGSNFKRGIAGIKSSTSEELRDSIDDAQRLRRAQVMSDQVRGETRALIRETASIGSTGIDAQVASATENLEVYKLKAADYRFQASQLGSTNPAASTELFSRANQFEAAATGRYRAQMALAARDRGLQAGGLVADVISAKFAAAGNEYAAQRVQTLAGFQAAETQESNPVARFLMHWRNRAVLASQDVVHRRQLTEQAEDVGVETMELSSEMPALSPMASYQIRRRALRNRKKLAVARHLQQNPNDAAGATALGDLFDEQTNVMDANAAFAQAQENIIGAGGLESTSLLLRRRPLDAQISAIQTRTRLAVSRAGGISPTGGLGVMNPAAIMAIRQGQLDERLARQEDADQTANVDQGLDNQRRQLDALTGRGGTSNLPFSTRSQIAAVLGIAGAGEEQAQQLQQKGYSVQALKSLSNTSSQLDVAKLQVLDNVHGQQFDVTHRDLTNKRDTEDIGSVVQAIEKMQQEITQKMLDGINNILKDLLPG